MTCFACCPVACIVDIDLLYVAMRSACKLVSELSRVWLTQNFTVDQCGPVHITMGDGGNIEGVCKYLVLLYLYLPLPCLSLPPDLHSPCPQTAAYL